MRTEAVDVMVQWGGSSRLGGSVRVEAIEEDGWGRS